MTAVIVALQVLLVVLAAVGVVWARQSRKESAAFLRGMERLTEERDAAREYAQSGDTYQHDLGAARAWAFGQALDLITGRRS